MHQERLQFKTLNKYYCCWSRLFQTTVCSSYGQDYSVSFFDSRSHGVRVLLCNERNVTFVANLLSYIPVKYYSNWSTSDFVIAKTKRVNFFETQCSVVQYTKECAVSYWFVLIIIIIIII